MNLTSTSEIKRIMEKHGLQFQKQFGQNFLINPAIPGRIADEAGKYVLEIGPGIGTLTRELCRRAEKVAAVEIDRGLIPVLEETLADFDNVKVICEDVMKLSIADFVNNMFKGERITVCANLPYYITTPVIMLLLESGAPIDKITVMVQKEVAQRLSAIPGTPQYGAVTASVSWYGSVKKLFDVPAGNFIPRPKVDSSVIQISAGDGLRASAAVKDEKLLFRVISAAFAQRRKTLANSLSFEFSNVSKERISEIIQNCGFESGIRGEKLSIYDFVRLSDKLFDEF